LLESGTFYFALTELCRAAGIRYRDMETEDGVRLAVAGASCRYSFPARYDEEVIVEARIEEANPRMVRFGYQFTSAESGRKLAAGETRHIFCNREMKPARLPARYYPLFGIGTDRG
jgi:acyl-CoA thioester hydrolase